MLFRSVDNKNFKWNSTLTFAANHEEITDLIDGKDIIGAERITESLLIGRPLRSYRYFINEGVWQESEAARSRFAGRSSDVQAVRRVIVEQRRRRLEKF